MNLGGKEAALHILGQYKDHCQTTVNMGDINDIESLKEVNMAIKWVKSKL